MLPSGSPSDVLIIFYTLDSGVCAVSITKKECRKEVAPYIGMDHKAISNTRAPRECFVTIKGNSVVFNNKGSKACTRSKECVCRESYGLEEKHCANPLSKPACKEAANVLGLKWRQKPIHTKNKPRGCFIDRKTVKFNKNVNKIPRAHVLQNTTQSSEL